MKALKKTLSLILAVAMIAAFIPAAFAAKSDEYNTEGILANASIEEDFQDFFGYVPDTVHSGTAVTYSASTGTVDAATITIDFESEIIYWSATPAAEANTPAYYTLDGEKWTAMKFSIAESAAAAIEDGQKDFKKILDKGATKFLLTNALGADKKPQKAVVADVAAGTEAIPAAATYTIGKINARPKLDKFTVDYLKFANPGAAGDWTLVNGNGKQKVADLQIAYTADGKNPAKGENEAVSGYGMFPVATYSLPVKAPATTGKVDKFSFLIRVAPTATSAGSKAKKISVSSLIKAPNLKVDYKKGILKPKADTIITKSLIVTDTDDKGVIAPKSDTDDTPNATPTTYTLSTKAYAKTDKAVKDGLPIKEYTGTVPDYLTTNTASTNYLHADNTDTTLYYGAGYAVYTTATAKKPASVAQNILIKDTSDIYEAEASVIVNKNTVKLPAGYEACLWADRAKADTKWKASIKADKNAVYAVRMKNNAKFDAKTGNTSGNTLSGNLILDVVTGKDSKGKTIVTAAAYLWTTKTGTVDPTSDDDKETASAATFAVYPRSAADTVKTVKLNTTTADDDADSYTDVEDEIELFAIGASNTSVASNTAAAVTGLAAQSSVVTVTYTAAVATLFEDKELTVDFKVGSGATGKAKDNFYAPTLKCDVLVDNKSFVDAAAGFLKGLNASDLTVANASGNNVQATVEAAFKAKITAAESSPKEITAVFTAAGGTVSYKFTEFKAPTGTGTAGTAAAGNGSLKCEATVKRGDYEVVVNLIVPAFFLDA